MGSVVQAGTVDRNWPQFRSDVLGIEDLL